MCSPDVSLCIGASEDSLTDIGRGMGELNRTCTLLFFGFPEENIDTPKGSPHGFIDSASGNTSRSDAE
jgi:hypothetical protein